MQTHLKLENFKIRRSTGSTRLPPITLLLGTNSSGKSSLIQSLLLTRQTVKGPNDPSSAFRLLSNGEHCEFGEYRTQRLVLAAWDALQAREAA